MRSAAAAQLLSLLLLCSSPGAGVLGGWLGSLPLLRTTAEAPPLPSPRSVAPLILFKDEFFGRDFVHRNYSFQDCSVSCALSWNASREKEAAAVFFHSVWTSRAKEFPQRRLRPDALWVWTAAEAPSNWDVSVEQSAGLLPPDPTLDRQFNLSMTYRQDSDILFNQGGTTRLSPPSNQREAKLREARLDVRTRSWFDAKHKLAAWTVSHCWTASRREEYVARLRVHLTVDVFGKCGGTWSMLAGAGHVHHAAMLKRSYMFYLAFENRLCKDYITEKFWVDALLNAAIPVVRGGLSDADYRAAAPPGSYVNADWFDSPAELAEHLRAVAGNYTLFASYHRWRLTHSLVVTQQDWARNHIAEEKATCRLCEYLHAHPHPSATLNLTQFWSGDVHCRKPTDVRHAHVLMDPHGV